MNILKFLKIRLCKRYKNLLIHKNIHKKKLHFIYIYIYISFLLIYQKLIKISLTKSLNILWY